jgi:hypothetical protein
MNLIQVLELLSNKDLWHFKYGDDDPWLWDTIICGDYYMYAEYPMRIRNYNGVIYEATPFSYVVIKIFCNVLLYRKNRVSIWYCIYETIKVLINPIIIIGLIIGVTFQP